MGDTLLKLPFSEVIQDPKKLDVKMPFLLTLLAFCLRTNTSDTQRSKEYENVTLWHRTPISKYMLVINYNLVLKT